MAHPPSLATITQWAAQRYGGAPALRFRRDESWHDYSYEDLHQWVSSCAAALQRLGVTRDDRVALMAQTSPEWTVCDLAITALGAICVPIYPTSFAEECAWVLTDSGARLVVCGDETQRSRVGDVPAVMLASLTSDPLTQPATAPLRAVPPSSAGNSAVATMPSRTAHAPATLTVPVAAAAPAEAEVNTIIYTSGTTGRPPKGCLITHRNWWATLEAITSMSSLGPGSTLYLYLPLAHMFARTIQLASIMSGATLAYWGGDMSRVVDELAEVKPTHLPSVPMLFEKVYARVVSMLDEDQREEYGPAIVAQLFGGNLVEALTGGAPIAKEILEFFQRCGIPIYEAYGLTESTALISSNVPGATKLGTVGRPLPGVEVRIAPDGEVLTRGAHVFAGYHRNETTTVVDGWLHTGDLGELDDDGYLTITGRKKELIITSTGKNISPASLENDLRRCQWVSHAVMFGDRRPYAVALITLDAAEIEQADISSAEACDQVDRHVTAVNERYAPPEQVRRHLILDHDFAVATGELTPSLKIRRDTVAEQYSHLLDYLYEN